MLQSCGGTGSGVTDKKKTKHNSKKQNVFFSMEYADSSFFLNKSISESCVELRGISSEK